MENNTRSLHTEQHGRLWCADIGHVESCARVDKVADTTREVVDDDNLVFAFDEGNDEVGADGTGDASDQCSARGVQASAMVYR